MKSWIHAALATIAMGSAACGGATDNSAPASASGAGSQPDPGGTPRSTADEGPSSSDPCSIVRPGSARPLPAGVALPPTPAPGLQITFTLANQRLEATAIGARQVVPAWTSKDTQIFAPGTTAGTWVETRDAAGTLSYQRNLHDPLGRTMEVAPDPNDPAEGWQNIERCSATATFRVDIPGDAAEIRVYGSERSDSETKLLAWYRLR